ncbi:polysaccharide biosynthesis C-terminal domain-containing protein [Glutamicibacter ardleyensis]|uniref:polysaccharide biosynthesis C-terminal domain-containing protein n=1 Tax=Glutamicibacter ardleyensis TaxID=225894 RepID=UPI003FCF2AF8
MKLALTGAGGFLGWHTRILAFARGIDEVNTIKLGDHFDLNDATSAMDNIDRLVHIAGINRGPDNEVEQGNILFAEQLVFALEMASNPPKILVYANSIQTDLDNPYGRGKRVAAEILASNCHKLGIQFIELKLPNLFGEEGRPFYNSVVATFAHQVAQGQTPTLQEDRELSLMHAQEAARLMLDATDSSDIDDSDIRKVAVSAIAQAFVGFHEKYELGEIPDISTPLMRDLFNVYRAASFQIRAEIILEPKRDARGFLVETLKSHGGEGQTFFSTTKPGITRGDHYHLRKVERFIVLAGEAKIQLRKMFTDTVIDILVNGEEPSAVDMPIGWVHNLTNTGNSELLTQFWTNEIFNASDTDTFYEKV